MPLDPAYSTDGTLATAGALAAWIIDSATDSPKLPHPLDFGIPEASLPCETRSVRQFVLRLLRECRIMHPDSHALDSDFMLARDAVITAIENAGCADAIRDFGFSQRIEERNNPVYAITTPVPNRPPDDVLGALRWSLEVRNWCRVVGEVPLKRGGYFTGGAQAPRLLFVTTTSGAKRLDARLVELRTAGELVYDWQITAAFDGGQLVWCLGPDDARLNGQRRFDDVTAHQIRDDLIALQMLAYSDQKLTLSPPVLGAPAAVAPHEDTSGGSLIA